MKYQILWDPYDGIALPEGRVRAFVASFVATGGCISIGDMEIFAELRIYVKAGSIPYNEIEITDLYGEKFYFDKKAQPTPGWWSKHCRLYDEQLHTLICC